MNECSNPNHPPGEVTGTITRETDRVLYQERVCTVCGRVQGIARVIKVHFRTRDGATPCGALLWTTTNRSLLTRSSDPSEVTCTKCLERLTYL